MYYLYTSTATLSGLASIAMISLVIRTTQNLSHNLISQSLILYGCFDLLGTFSWYLGNKYDASFELCATQEYIFQAANLLKATTTVLISYLASYVVNELKPPQLDKIFLIKFSCLYAIPLMFVGLSIYFKSAVPFCGNSISDEHNLAYVGVFLPPLYVCVVINFVLFREIKQRTKHIVQFFSDIYQTSSSNVNAQLLAIVNKLRIYPNVFAFCWLPEVVYIIVFITLDWRISSIGIISGVCINSTGTMVAVCYFYQHYIKQHSPPSNSVDQGREDVISDTDSSQTSNVHSSAQNPIVASSLNETSPRLSADIA